MNISSDTIPHAAPEQEPIQKKREVNRLRLTVLILVFFAIFGFVSAKVYDIFDGHYDMIEFQRSLQRFRIRQ